MFVNTMWAIKFPYGVPRTFFAVAAAALVVLPVVASGCGSSTETSVVAPSPRCGVSITNNTSTVPAAGGNGSLIVNVERECAWSARAEASWITLGGTGGQGTATLSYTVAPNPIGTPRRGAIVVGEQRAEVAQEAAPCRFDVSPSSREVGAGGGEISFSVTVTDGCTWTARSDASWIASPQPAGGQGNGTVRFMVAANEGSSRNGTIRVAGVTVGIAQVAPGAPPPPTPAPGPPGSPPPAPPSPPPPSPPPTPAPSCGYSIKPTYYNAGRGPDDIRVNVTAENGCTWKATSPVSWATIAEGQTGSGGGSVRVVVRANSGPARNATLTIAGQPFELTQNGCPTSIKPEYYNSGKGPDTITISVTAEDGCTWTASSSVSWVTVIEGQKGAGNGTVRLQVERNDGSSRSATLMIAGKPFALTQQGSD